MNYLCATVGCREREPEPHYPFCYAECRRCGNPVYSMSYFHEGESVFGHFNQWARDLIGKLKFWHRCPVCDRAELGRIDRHDWGPRRFCSPKCYDDLLPF